MSGNFKVIFLDDEPMFLRSIERLMRKMNGTWSCSFFTDAALAFDEIKQHSSCVLVTDWMMPKTSGLDFAREVQEYTKKNQQLIYTILLTARSDSDDVVEGLDAGVDDFLSKPMAPGELQARIRVGIRMLKTLEQLKVANSKLTILAHTDDLTGLNNRRKGMEVLNRELEKVQRGLQPLSVVMVDIDKFKSLNDTLGHFAGDNAIQYISEILKCNLRVYDSCVRLGGDEFLIILPHMSRVHSEATLDRIHNELQTRHFCTEAGHLVPLSVSMGLAYVESGIKITAEDILKLADRAMYREKKLNRRKNENESFPEIFSGESESRETVI